MKRILVVYYSQSGHTEWVAQRIAACCNADLERIRDQQSRQGVLGYLRSVGEATMGRRPTIAPNQRRPSDYDLVILGTPVWCWNVASPVRTWIAENHRELRNVALFCTFGGAGDAKVLDDLERLCRHPALARMALRERAVRQCEHGPVFRGFLLELHRLCAIPLSLPPLCLPLVRPQARA